MDGLFARATSGLTNVVVAIPVQNEADRITDCLLALAHQDSCSPCQVVLLVNNTVDGTARIVEALQQSLPFQLTVVERHFPPGQRSAGHARRAAMQIAATQAGPDAVLLCTDADGQVAPNWLSANLCHLRSGADAVAGRVEIDPVEAALIPQALHDADARECAYAAILDEIDSLLDPDPADPWPRHTEHSGASICVTAAAFHMAGGIPALPVGEDRAFFTLLRRKGARIRHAMDVHVTVSGRLQGRAKGGMADTMRRRMRQPDLFLDDQLEPADAAWRRSRLRHRLRAAFSCPDRTSVLLAALGCSKREMERYGARGHFAAAWAELEDTCDTLRRELVAVADLPHEMARAVSLRDGLLLRGDQARAALAEAGLP